MPVSRAYINMYATTDSNQFQALTELANFADSLESAIGVRVGAGASSATAAPAPAAAAWNITAGNGHFMIQITNPTSSGTQAPLQHQIASSTSPSFDGASATTSFTLGLGETTRDVVDPGVTKYWRLCSRYAGSSWNNWQMYTTVAGVVALASGALKIS